MPYEVEQKYRIADLVEIEKRFSELGIGFHSTVRQVDTYFAHPVRDFALTDEALRIRRVGDKNCLTFKGPKLDATTKTRREIEIAIESGIRGAEQFGELLHSLDFSAVAEVSKTRNIFHFQFENHQFELSIDQINELGDFVELEVIVENQQELDAARIAVVNLAESLGLQDPERRSYLELLIEKREN